MPLNISKNSKTSPLISFVIPTLNSSKVLGLCLKSIKSQNTDIPYEIIIADGGSSDNTVDIANKYNCVIVKNKLKTAEAGKMVGVNNAKGEYIALIDSDNYLPHNNWLNLMMHPLLENPSIIGSEPWEFTYRKNGGFIERYSSLFGCNDPYCFVTGVYDRKNYINDRWTGLDLKTQENDKYVLVYFDHNSQLPTIGANGTIFRKSFLFNNQKGNYLFDIDIISKAIRKSKKGILFAKVKTGVIHSFCESSISKFIKKQKRRLTDYYFYKPLRQYKWSKVNKGGTYKFIVYTLLVFPPIIDAIIGYTKKRDLAWFFHPIACIISLFIYGSITTQKYFGLFRPIDRLKWQQ